MGTLFRVEIAGTDSATGVLLAEAAFDSVALVDSLLSTYREDSEVERWGRQEVGTWERASDVFIENILLARRAFEVTGGAFDVTLTGRMEEVLVDTLSRSVMPAQPGITLDFGGSAKGDALDRALRAIPLEIDALVDLGGQISVRSATGRVWQLAIVDPTDAGRTMAIIELSNGSVATSATYEKGDHIVDPRSGETPDELISSTVVHGNSAWADALSTGLFVLGARKALELADLLGVAFLGVRRADDELGPESILISDAMKEIVSLREDLAENLGAGSGER